MAVNLFMIMYVSILVKKWIRYEDDSNLTIIKNIDPSDSGDVHYNEIGIFPYFKLLDIRNNNTAMKLEELEKYIEVQIVN